MSIIKALVRKMDSNDALWAIVAALVVWSAVISHEAKEMKSQLRISIVNADLIDQRASASEARLTARVRNAELAVDELQGRTSSLWGSGTMAVEPTGDTQCPHCRKAVPANVIHSCDALDLRQAETCPLTGCTLDRRIHAHLTAPMGTCTVQSIPAIAYGCDAQSVELR